MIKALVLVLFLSGCESLQVSRTTPQEYVAAPDNTEIVEVVEVVEVVEPATTNGFLVLLALIALSAGVTTLSLKGI
jgi:PBP1b-binding outer membrane lipoprotein LpoB